MTPMTTLQVTEDLREKSGRTSTTPWLFMLKPTTWTMARHVPAMLPCSKRLDLTCTGGTRQHYGARIGLDQMDNELILRIMGPPGPQGPRLID